jgi:peptide deformylase
VSVQPLRLLGDPVLRTACDPVTSFGDATGRLVDDLLETVLLPGRAGLAAPQIGVSLAAFSYYIDGQHGCILNPVVVETSGDYDGPEACLSVTGELSRVLQHETDHLRGVLFIDRLTGRSRKDALRQLRTAAGPLSGAAG